MVGQSGTNKKNQQVIERYCRVLDHVFARVDELFDSVWDAIVDHSKKNGLVLLRSSYYNSAKTKWLELENSINEQLTVESAPQARGRIEGFIIEHGPISAALHLFVRISLPPYNAPVDTVRSVVEKQLHLYPDDPLSYEDAGDVELEFGTAERALDIVDSALLTYPHHAGLLFTRVEALAACGRNSDAYTFELTCRDIGLGNEVMIARARGLVRSNQLTAAAEIISELEEKEGQSWAVRRFVCSDPLLECLIVSGHVSPLTNHQKMQEVVQTNLTSDNNKSFFGLPNDVRMENACSEFVFPSGEEETLFLLDWSVWGNAKTGFALTSEKAAWKCMWEEPVQISFSEVYPDDVSSSGSRLIIGVESVDMEDGSLASSLEKVVKELIVITALARAEEPIGSMLDCSQS